MATRQTYVGAFGPETGGTLYRLQTGKLDPETFDSVSSWVGQCYHRPSDEELTLCAMNEVLEGYGTEAIRIEGAYLNSFYLDIAASYVNMGDSYATTVLIDHESGRYRVGCWADFAENLERKHAH